jgi:hypothetical protein
MELSLSDRVAMDMIRREMGRMGAADLRSYYEDDDSTDSTDAVASPPPPAPPMGQPERENRSRCARALRM